MEERSKMNPDAELNDLGTIVIQTAISVHRSVGPGLLESVYEAILSHELRKRGLAAERQVAVAFVHDGIRFDEGFRADIVVAGRIILELKSVEVLSPAHKKQLLTYLRLSGLRLGYLLNFGAALMKDGIVRMVNGLTEGSWSTNLSAFLFPLRPLRLCERLLFSF